MPEDLDRRFSVLGYCFNFPLRNLDYIKDYAIKTIRLKPLLLKNYPYSIKTTNEMETTWALIINLQLSFQTGAYT